MNPKYVTSLELSKKLKDAGVKQESEWYWHVHEDPQVPQHSDYLFKKDEDCRWDVAFCEYISAFHVGELMEQLLLIKQILWFYHNANNYITRNESTGKEIDEENLPEALGKHLLEIYE